MPRWSNTLSALRRGALGALLAASICAVGVVVASKFEVHPLMDASAESLRVPAISRDSRPWVGVNVWGLAAARDVFTCGASDRDHTEHLDATFDHLRAAGITVVRFWAFQSYATDDRGARNWRALDRVFERAQAHGVRLIPVLGNNWTDCDYWPVTQYPHGGQRKDEVDWYRDGYRRPYDGYEAGYPDWQREIVARYCGHDALLTWELINEPRARSYAPGDTEVLAAFLRDGRDLIRELDPVTPISFGSIANGEPGFDGARYRILTHEADYATAHDYDHLDPRTAPASCETNCSRAAQRDAALERRPFYVGEAGIDGCDTPERARLLTEAMRRAFVDGAAGYILWAYDDATPLDRCGFDFGPRSPILVAIARMQGLSP